MGIAFYKLEKKLRKLPAVMLAIDAERLLLEHCLQVPEKWLRAQLTSVGFNPVGRCFSHAVDLRERERENVGNFVKTLLKLLNNLSFEQILRFFLSKFPDFFDF
jgi:hypothetical protein